MKTLHALLAAASIGALIAPNAYAAPPHKKAHHAHAKKGAPAGDGMAKESMLKGEVDELKAQVAALREEIRAQRDTTVATQSQVAQTQAQSTMAAQTAATAQTRADTALAKADAVQAAEVKTDKAVSAVSWAGNTKVGGTVFFNASNLNQQSNGTKLGSNGTGFNVKRIYLSVDHKFSDIWSANITTDISNVIGETGNNNYQAPVANTSTGAISSIGDVGKGLYIKKAFVQAKLNPAFTVRAGAADAAWVPYIEGMYGHRYIENVLIDEYKLGTSTDWGIDVLGDLAGGLISYQVGVVNGSGYRNVTVNNSVDLDGRISLQYKGFFAAVGGYTGRLGKNFEGAVLTHRAERVDGAVGFKNALFTVGGEYVYAKNFNSVTSATQDRNEGVSGFGSVNFAPKWQAFGRYDWIRQTSNTTTNAQTTNNYFNVGLQWEPVNLIDLSLVYKRAKATNDGIGSGMIAWQNGTGSIGGTNNGTYDEFGIFALLKF